MAELAAETCAGPVVAVMGGFHMGPCSPRQIQDAIGRLEGLGVRRAAPCHCSGDKAREQFERHFGMQMPRVSAALLGRALGQRDKGSDQAAKLLYERFDKGYAPRSRQDIAADVAVRKTYINVDTDKVTGVEDGEGA